MNTNKKPNGLNTHAGLDQDKQLIYNVGAGIQAGECPVVYFPGDDLFAALRVRGLPIGNLTSQFMANVYLHELDMFVKHVLRCPAYLRYMDDFLMFSDDKAQLHGWKAATGDFSAAWLRLLLHPRKSVVFPIVIVAYPAGAQVSQVTALFAGRALEPDDA